jgi:hypothetical protein
VQEHTYKNPRGSRSGHSGREEIGRAVLNRVYAIDPPDARSPTWRSRSEVRSTAAGRLHRLGRQEGRRSQEGSQSVPASPMLRSRASNRSSRAARRGSCRTAKISARPATRRRSSCPARTGRPRTPNRRLTSTAVRKRAAARKTSPDGSGCPGSDGWDEADVRRSSYVRLVLLYSLTPVKRRDRLRLQGTSAWETGNVVVMTCARFGV